MRLSVELVLPNGERVVVGHGAIIGRLWSADLQINDARISEAHAMVSLRGREAHLLALRGRFAVKKKKLSSVVLYEGLRVDFASDLQITVLKVIIPEGVLAICAPKMAAQVLNGVSSIFVQGGPRIVSGWASSADDYVWPTGDGWMRGTGEPVPLMAGDQWKVSGVPFEAKMQSVSGVAPTVMENDFRIPLTIEARFDTVHIRREGEPPVVITGQVARALSELATIGTAVNWEVIANSVWGDTDRQRLRRRWDTQLWRLRARLRNHGIRESLIRADGSGLIELVLNDGDKIIDAT